MSDLRENILNYIYNHGPVTSEKLQQVFNVSDAVVRHAIRELNFQGYPIVSGSYGFKVGTPEEVHRYIGNLRSRAFGNLERASKMKQVLLQLTNQSINL